MRQERVSEPMTKLYPLLFEPVLKDYLWGGRTLESQLGRAIPPGIVAESWEIAAHPDGATIVTNGPFAGRTLVSVHEELGLDLIGTNSMWAQERGKFPLLVKLLDANDRLSVQVHPGDPYALEHEGNELGKTEMWVVLHAEPDAAINLGVKAGTTRERFAAALEDGTLESLLHILPIKTGDVVCIPSGSVHALLGGALIAEVLQNSNTTYRVFDWNRLRDGKPRELHVQKALDVINFDQVEPDLPAPKRISGVDESTVRHLLCENQYFRTERVFIPAGETFTGMCDGATFEIWGAIDGRAVVNEVLLEAVQFALLPATLGPFSVQAVDGDAVLMRTFVPAA